MADKATVSTALNVAAQRRRSAELDGAHHSPLNPAQVAVVGSDVGVAVAAEDTRYLQTGRHAADQAGGTTSRVSRSSGLSVRRMSLFETRV